MSKYNSTLKYVASTPRSQRKGKGARYYGSTIPSLPSAGGVSLSYVEANFVTLNTEQAISGIKDFTNGLKVGGLSVYKSQADTIYLNANLVVRGGITAFGTNETITASIFEALPIDGATLKRTENGVLYVDTTVVGGGGGTGGGISIADVESYLTTNGYATQSWVTGKGYITSSALEPYALKTAIPTNTNQLTNGAGFITDITGAMVTSALRYTPYNSANFTKANIKSTLGISDWALASAKPNYTATEVGAVTESPTIHSGSLNDFITAGIYRFNIPADTTEGITNYGNLFVIRGGNHDTLSQLYFNHDGVGRIFCRSGDMNTYTSKSWRPIAFTSDIPVKLSQLTDDVVSGKYLPITGGTVDGDLLFTAAGAGRKFGIYKDGSIKFNATTRGGWGTGLFVYSNDGSTQLGTSAGAFGSGGNLSYFYYGGSWNSPYMAITNAGNVGIGTKSPSEKLHVYGNILATGGITAQNSSDRRLKKNIRKFNASKTLMSLGGMYEYEYIDSEVQKNHIYEGTHYGLIYQHVKGTALDVMCHKREDGMGALNYLHPKFISLIAGAIMENISEVEKLKRKIRHLEQKVKQLEQRA